MANAFSDASAEVGVGLALSGLAERSTEQAKSGLKSFKLRSQSFGGPVSTSTVQDETMVCVPGVEYGVTFWYRANDAQSTPLTAEVKQGFGPWVQLEQLLSTDGDVSASGWAQRTGLTFICTDAAVQMRFVSGDPGISLFNHWWYVDLIVVEALVATRRSEIRDAVKTFIEGVTVANGYDVTVGEVITGRRNPSKMNAYPSVQIPYGVEIRDLEGAPSHTIECTMDLPLELIASGGNAADDQLDDLAENIETALATRSSNDFLGLNYVHDVQVARIEPAEPDEAIAETIRKWYAVVRVRYWQSRPVA